MLDALAGQGKGAHHGAAGGIDDPQAVTSGIDGEYLARYGIVSQGVGRGRQL